MKKEVTFEDVKKAAVRVGIPLNTVYQWKHRGQIPYEARVKISMANAGTIGLHDFESILPPKLLEQEWKKIEKVKGK